jgi:hypothetical protein
MINLNFINLEIKYSLTYFLYTSFIAIYYLWIGYIQLLKRTSYIYIYINAIVYSPTKVKHHLTCFNNIFSNNELISNRFAVFVTYTHILTYLWNRLLIDFYFSTFVFANESWFFLCRVLSFIFYWFGMARRKLTIPERWQAVSMHNGGFSHRRGADHFRDNHSIIVRLMQRFRQMGNVTDRPCAGRPRKTTPREDRLISRRAR